MKQTSIIKSLTKITCLGPYEMLDFFQPYVVYLQLSI